MDDRNIVVIYPSVHNTTRVINYDAGNSAVNTFLWHFDIWGSNGHFVRCSDDKHCSVEFECSSEFYQLAQTEDFQRAFKHMKTNISFDPLICMKLD